MVTFGCNNAFFPIIYNILPGQIIAYAIECGHFGFVRSE